ncbi:molecular chaperone, partial [Escherichia coli]
INSRIKLIYRPHKLNETDKVNAAFKSLKILKKNEYISIENATPYYITMDNVKINNKKVTSIEDFMVAPYSEFKIPTQNAKSFSYTTINDYGGKNPIIDIKF